MYEYDERTGKGRRLPDNHEQINDLAPIILDVLDNYIGNRFKIPKEKIAEEIEIQVLMWMARQKLAKQLPRPAPPLPDCEGYGE